jgi:hypothetical protein
MKELALYAPVNNLSFGNVTYNFLKELYKRDCHVVLFPIGEGLNFSAFDKADEDFKSWVQDCAKNRLTSIKQDMPTLKMWHLVQGEQRITPRQYLYTFYELDSPTAEEKCLASLQNKTFFSSSDAASRFTKGGCTNASYIPIGFDTDFYKTGKVYHKDKVHFVLMGKFEKRKHTDKIIKMWAKKYGNKNDYQLTCCVTNPFFKPEQMQQVLQQTLQGQRYFNINFLPFLNTNSEVNELMNSADIDLTGLSGAEGWNLPAFNMTCLGKWSLVLNGSSHKDWATEENCILIEPSCKIPAHDGVFFKKGEQFNQGNIHDFDEEYVATKKDLAVETSKAPNIQGEQLQNNFTYKKTVDKILDAIKLDLE